VDKLLYGWKLVTVYYMEWVRQVEKWWDETVGYLMRMQTVQIQNIAETVEFGKDFQLTVFNKERVKSILRCTQGVDGIWVSPTTAPTRDEKWKIPNIHGKHGAMIRKSFFRNIRDNSVHTDIYVCEAWFYLGFIWCVCVCLCTTACKIFQWYHETCQQIEYRYEEEMWKVTGGLSYYPHDKTQWVDIKKTPELLVNQITSDTSQSSHGIVSSTFM